MFWGLPTSVAALPVLAAVASASRKGRGGSSRARISPTTIGVPSTQIASLVSNAESTPEPQTIAASKRRGS